MTAGPGRSAACSTPGPSAYSCLAILPEGAIGLLYETGIKSAYEGIALARFSMDWLTNRNDEQAQRVTNQPPVLNKAFISFRIGVPQWMPEDRYRELLGWFEKVQGRDRRDHVLHLGHASALPLDEMRRAAIPGPSGFRRPRRWAIAPASTCSPTMGHHNENLPNSLSGDYTRVTDIDGNVSPGFVLSERSAISRSYVRESVPARRRRPIPTTSGSTTTCGWPATCRSADLLLRPLPGAVRDRSRARNVRAAA